MTDKEQLEPCPFCGGDAEYHDMSDNMQRHWCGCNNQNCPSYEDLFETAEEAIKAWNTRPAPSNEAALEAALQLKRDDKDGHLSQEDVDAFFETVITALQQSQPVDAVDAEWFFRWIARGKGGHTPMEQAIEMIWNSPLNPYADNNPWADGEQTPQAPVDVDTVRQSIAVLLMDNSEKIEPDSVCEDLCQMILNVATKPRTPQAHIDVEALKAEICMNIKYGDVPPTPDVVKGAGIGIGYTIDHLAPLIRGQEWKGLEEWHEDDAPAIFAFFKLVDGVWEYYDLMHTSPNTSDWPDMSDGEWFVKWQTVTTNFNLPTPPAQEND